MLKSPLHEFVNDCIARNQDADGLTLEELYGLYLSWCSLRRTRPLQPELSEPGCAQRTSSPTATAACAPGWR